MRAVANLPGRPRHYIVGEATACGLARHGLSGPFSTYDPDATTCGNCLRSHHLWNVCEHGDHRAPVGRRFCSRACEACEHEAGIEVDHTKQECAGICKKNRRPYGLRPRSSRTRRVR